MNKKVKKYQNRLVPGNVDARVISLRSKDIGMPPDMSAGANSYELFEYFDELQVEAVEPRKTPLTGAYRVSRRSTRHDSRQTLLAFTDILEENTGEKAKEYSGFTRQEIDAFWEDNSEPILFTTLINVEDDDKFKLVIDRVKTTYPKGKYLIYFTLDYCSIVIFLKGHSFQKCAHLMFELDYGQNSPRALLVDSITLFGFAKGFDFENVVFPPEDPLEEPFGVYLRFGVADADRMEQYCKKLIDWTKASYGTEISKNWVLGRYDIGVFHPNADLKWIKKAIELADRVFTDQQEARLWYTIHTLTILVRPKDDLQFHGHVSIQNESCVPLKEHMLRKYKEFEAAYTGTCKRLDVQADEVWLKWIKTASAQAVSFLGNNMTTDLGICLVPQFLDFLEYARRLWESDKFKADCVEKAEECFSIFFTNISVLVDSMNHSSRQFILTPSFRTVAFEMPPKVMAYYIAVTHALIDAFQDDEAHYGFTISLKFVRGLDVQSLVQKEITGTDQFITIGIDEERLCRLQNTTVVLAHEISHYVGDDSRNRECRKRCVLRTELHNVLIDLAGKLHNTLVHYCKNTCVELGIKLDLRIPDDNAFYIPWSALETEVNELLKILEACEPDYGPSKCYYKKDLESLLLRLPYHLYNNPELTERLFEFLWEALIADESGVTVLGRAMGALELYYNGINIPQSEESDAPNRLRLPQEFLKYRVHTIYRALLPEYAENYGRQTGNELPRFKQTCDMFSEAYADLQAILLFELKWKEYCHQFLRPNEKIPEKALQRLLVIAAIQFSQGNNEVTGNAEVDAHFAQISQLAKRTNKNKEDIEQWSAEALKAKVDPTMHYYLMRYLTKCSKSIKAHFDDKKQDVENLRKIYGALSDKSGAYQMVSDLMKFISDYRKNIQDVK